MSLPQEGDCLTIVTALSFGGGLEGRGMFCISGMRLDCPLDLKPREDCVRHMGMWFLECFLLSQEDQLDPWLLEVSAVLLLDIRVLVSLLLLRVCVPQWTLTGIEALLGQLLPSPKTGVWSSLYA